MEAGAGAPAAAAVPPVALDGYGADQGVEVIAAGATAAARDGIPVRIFGPAGTPLVDGVELVTCEESISNAEDPVPAVRGRESASVVQAAQAVAGGECSALVSAGSTGATLAAATLTFRRLRGVVRPGLAAQVPLPPDGSRRLLLLDVGANSEARALHLVQFAFVGAAFGESILGISSPRVALLNVGEEPGKGSQPYVDAHQELSAAQGIDFVGNAEGRDLFADVADVMICDGFTGNIALKGMEGTARAVADGVRTAARSGSVSRLGGLLLRPALGDLRQTLDPDATGGAVLLGLRGTAVVAHGSSGASGIANAIRLAHRSAREGVPERIAERLERSGVTRKARRRTPPKSG